MSRHTSPNKKFFSYLNMTNLLSTTFDRVGWATVHRKERNNRQLVYSLYFSQLRDLVSRMWERVGDGNPVTALGNFSKENAQFTMVFTAGDKVSDIWIMGENEKGKAKRLLKYFSGDYVPFHTTKEVIAATIIAQMNLGDGEGSGFDIKDEVIQEIIHNWYMLKGPDPTRDSWTWLHRLNTTVCNLWQSAPVLQKASEICAEKSIPIADAVELAFESVGAVALPDCGTSNNQDGRYNISYKGSCYYTIDHYGVAICKEFPNELLDLSDYETMKRVAATICKDINGDDVPGLGDALWWVKEEPEWTGACVLASDQVDNEE